MCYWRRKTLLKMWYSCVIFRRLLNDECSHHHHRHWWRTWAYGSDPKVDSNLIIKQSLNECSRALIFFLFCYFENWKNVCIFFYHRKIWTTLLWWYSHNEINLQTLFSHVLCSVLFVVNSFFGAVADRRLFLKNEKRLNVTWRSNCTAEKECDFYISNSELRSARWETSQRRVQQEIDTFGSARHCLESPHKLATLPTVAVYMCWFSV